MLADREITPTRFRGKEGAVLFAGCVTGVEGEGKDVETECGAKNLMMARALQVNACLVSSCAREKAGHNQGIHFISCDHPARLVFTPRQSGK
jgi:hypothetical protein